MPKLTQKSMKDFAKENACNSSKEALTLMKEYGFQRADGLKVWALAVNTAKSNGRKTVMDKDVKGLLDLHKILSETSE